MRRSSWGHEKTRYRVQTYYGPMPQHPGPHDRTQEQTVLQEPMEATQVVRRVPHLPRAQGRINIVAITHGFFQSDF